MSSWHSYPKIYNVGHAYLDGFFDGIVYVEEKIDGSQFSFGVFAGELRARSKGQQLVVTAPEKMFNKAIDSIRAIRHLLHDGWTYRGEFLASPKHNTLAYDRYPNGHIILFDVNPGEERYLQPHEKAEEAERLGLECVQVLYTGLVTADVLKSLLEKESALGGTKIEGVVCKRLPENQVYGPDKKALIAKHVSEAFKEIHGKEWKKSNPTGKDFVGALAERFCAEGRWAKAVQHLRERGELDNTPRDIPALIHEVNADIKTECLEEITRELLRYAMPHIMRASTKGLPDWYKTRLLERQFEERGE